MPEFDTLDFDITEGLATITFNRPDRLNALSGQLKSDLLEALRFLGRPDSGARALLITGKGRGFCAGADLAESGMSEDRDLGASLTDTYHPFLTELANLKIPVVSAVNGVAAGAGMSIAISADIVIAAKSAYFLQAFVNIALVPDAGSTYILPRLVGLSRARAMMMLGEKLPADKALEWGLVYDVVEDEALLETATTLAKKLASGPTVALSGIRQLMAQSMNNDYQAQLAAEASAQRVAGRSADCIEGVMAFLQKRPADFKGQ
ncbi:MAG: enoyl-CoA hydratase/isomerase family protein [Alphaproteobacteria bacterium]|nr:enoyl-CoA hydratase/isomerase family protein [Alphaproteobacteria bacterium]